MKSYLKFLSRNKLYTAIEAVGLIVSLAFIVIISCYTWQQFAVTREVPDYERVYALTKGDDYLAPLRVRCHSYRNGFRMWKRQPG